MHPANPDPGEHTYSKRKTGFFCSKEGLKISVSPEKPGLFLNVSYEIYMKCSLETKYWIVIMLHCTLMVLYFLIQKLKISLFYFMLLVYTLKVPNSIAYHDRILAFTLSNSVPPPCNT